MGRVQAAGGLDLQLNSFVRTAVLSRNPCAQGIVPGAKNDVQNTSSQPVILDTIWGNLGGLRVLGQGRRETRTGATARRSGKSGRSVHPGPNGGADCGAAAPDPPRIRQHGS